MIQFLTYLFESGLCLTILFLVYFLFLRMETYFTFNRIYLLSVLVFSLFLPLIHLNFSLSESPLLQKQAEEIKEFRNYYERLISLTDPDYSNSFTITSQKNRINEFEDSTLSYTRQNQPLPNYISDENNSKIKTGNFNWARLLLTIYLSGILFFAVRLISLFRWINRIIKKYGSTVDYDFKMVKMDEEVPPFSFFRFVFLNKETISFSEFQQIVAHEKVHIHQRHSIDLLLAHFITVFQWFNPFAWLINKAMKTNHEYIADRNVVEQGYELFDYQSLLLKQMISIRSVELVNNFNLINIKKRLAMMTKIKSGLPAQLKALVVIPAALFLFFFFAEITFAQNTIGFENKDLTKELQGFWKNERNDTYGMLLNFKGNNLQILENDENYRELNIKFPNGTISSDKENFNKTDISKYAIETNELSSFVTLPMEPGKSKLIHVILKSDKLIIGWTVEQVSIYKKIKAKYSLGYFLDEMEEDFEPVTTTYYRITENPEKTYYIFMNSKNQIFINNEKIDISNFKDKIKEVKQKGNPFGYYEKTPVIAIDSRCEMAYVNVIYRKLREMGELRFVISVSPLDSKVPEIFYHNLGIPRLLPPIDVQILDEKEVAKSGVKIYRIDLSKGKISAETVSNQLDKEIQENQKYMILFTYNNETSYKEYLTVLDKVYQVVFDKRNLLAQKNYKLNYDDLGQLQQKEIQKVYPLTLTEQNVDQTE